MLLVDLEHDVAVVLVRAPSIAVTADLPTACLESFADRLSGQQGPVERPRELRRLFVVDRPAAADVVTHATLEERLSDACEPLQLLVGGQRLPLGRDCREADVGEHQPWHLARAEDLRRGQDAVLSEDPATSGRIVLVMVAVTGVMNDIEGQRPFSTSSI